jgi:hypothetical protein
MNSSRELSSLFRLYEHREEELIIALHAEITHPQRCCSLCSLRFLVNFVFSPPEPDQGNHESWDPNSGPTFFQMEENALFLGRIKIFF